MTSKKRARGAALMTALFVVALAALLVSGLLWRQHVQIRRLENQRLMMQARWVERSALDWIRLTLRALGAAASVDYLGGVWAVRLAPRHLSDVLGRAATRYAHRREKIQNSPAGWKTLRQNLICAIWSGHRPLVNCSRISCRSKISSACCRYSNLSRSWPMPPQRICAPRWRVFIRQKRKPSRMMKQRTRIHPHNRFFWTIWRCYWMCRDSRAK